MTDPGSLEIVTCWKVGQDANGIAIFYEVRTVRDAPSETVSHWERRHLEDVADAFANHPPSGQ